MACALLLMGSVADSSSTPTHDTHTHTHRPSPPRLVLFSRNPNSKLNQEIEEEVSAFTARASSQPTDDEFLVLENTVRELRAKYVKNGGNRSGSAATGSRGSSDGGRRGSAASRGGGTRSSSQRGVSESETGVRV